jgi:hypothetical protein
MQSKAIPIRRTLLGVAIGALLSMLFVPCVGHGYELIFNAFEYRINVPQLVLNVLFTIILGILVANFFRAALWTTAAVAVLVAWFGFSAFQKQMREGAESEQVGAWLATTEGNFEQAKEHWLKASRYWWWKGWWAGARNAKKNGFDRQTMERDAAASRARQDESRADQLLRAQPAWVPPEVLLEAKKLLLGAAENWHKETPFKSKGREERRRISSSRRVLALKRCQHTIQKDGPRKARERQRLVLGSTTIPPAHGTIATTSESSIGSIRLACGPTQNQPILLASATVRSRFPSEASRR